MEVLRDLIRDLVGIIFPGSLLVILTTLMMFGIAIVVFPPTLIDFKTFSESSIGLFSLLIFSYIGGQFLRLRKLNEVEKICTLEYKKSEVKSYRRNI